MTNTNDRCEYCRQVITDEAMGVIEKYDKKEGKRMCFCDAFCHLESMKDKRKHNDDRGTRK